MSTLFSLAGHIAGAWATATEMLPLLAIPALIWGVRTAIELLDRLATAIRLTYSAGRAVGALWFRHGLPLLLAAADLISAVVAEINWAEVFAIVRQGLTLVAAAVITAVLKGHRLLVKASALLGRRYSQLLVRQPVLTTATTTTVQAMPAPPAVHPLAVLSDDLATLTASQLRQLLGTRRRCSRQQLIAMALAY